MTAGARTLVATEVAADAEMVGKPLREEFNNVVVSIDPGRAVEDFEKHRTLILCNKDDLRRVYELCKKDYLDDFLF